MRMGSGRRAVAVTMVLLFAAACGGGDEAENDDGGPGSTFGSSEAASTSAGTVAAPSVAPVPAAENTVALEELPHTPDTLFGDDAIALQRSIAGVTRALESRTDEAEVDRIDAVNERTRIAGELESVTARLAALERETAERNARPLVRASNLLARLRRRLARAFTPASR